MSISTVNNLRLFLFSALSWPGSWVHLMHPATTTTFWWTHIIHKTSCQPASCSNILTYQHYEIIPYIFYKLVIEAHWSPDHYKVQSPTVRSFSWLHHQAISSTSISAFYVMSWQKLRTKFWRRKSLPGWVGSAAAASLDQKLSTSFQRTDSNEKNIFIYFFHSSKT